ncbi:MAG: hypothetical protein AAGF11_07455 [Myxococcota bacterium]
MPPSACMERGGGLRVSELIDEMGACTVFDPGPDRTFDPDTIPDFDGGDTEDEDTDAQAMDGY